MDALHLVNGSKKNMGSVVGTLQFGLMVIVRELITLQQSYAEFLMGIIKVPTEIPCVITVLDWGRCVAKVFSAPKKLLCGRLRICKGTGPDEGVADWQSVFRIGRASAMSFVDVNVDVGQQ
jgi:hypothetical protein